VCWRFRVCIGVSCEQVRGGLGQQLLIMLGVVMIIGKLSGLSDSLRECFSNPYCSCVHKIINKNGLPSKANTLTCRTAS
jgi:hypothetical protein